MPHAVDRDYTGRDGTLISVMGEDGVVRRYDPTDVLETEKGRLTARQAKEQRVEHIYEEVTKRVQDSELLSEESSPFRTEPN